MEKIQHRNLVRISKSIIDQKEECGVSGNFTLPDYCADIATVMTCTMTPHLLSRQWSGDRLLIDGAADVRVLYLDEDRKCVHTTEFSLPFAIEFKAESSNEPTLTSVDLKTNYINWRVVSSRCIEIRGAVSVELMALSSEDVELLEVLDDCIETKICDATVTAPTYSAEKIITVSEQMDFPQDKPSAEMLLGGTCFAELSECRLLNGKAIVKGVLQVHQLYSYGSEGESTECLNFSIPFSHILDMEGVREGQLHSIHICCLSDVERCLTGPDGENSVFELTAKLLIQVCVWEETQTSFLLDAYHTQYPLTTNHKEFEHYAFLGYCDEQSILPIPVELPLINLKEILDVWTQIVECEANVRGKMAVLTGKIDVNMLLRDHDGYVSHMQKREEFCFELPCVGDVIKSNITISGVQYRIDGSHLQLQLRLCAHMNMFRRCYYRIITEILPQEECAYPKETANLLIYYASPGESVWEIGRICHASAKDICLENSLSSDVIDHPTLLSIPL